MKLVSLVFGMIIFMLLGSILMIILPIIPVAVESRVYEGNITDIRYTSGGFFRTPTTIIQIENGDVLTFIEYKENKEKIIKTRTNIHMEYRTNTYGISFLDVIHDIKH